MHVALSVYMMVCDSRINDNLAILNYLDILHITAADNECHPRVIYCSLFYYTVTGGRGVTEVRQSCMNVTGGGKRFENRVRERYWRKRRRQRQSEHGRRIKKS